MPPKTKRGLETDKKKQGNKPIIPIIIDDPANAVGYNWVWNKWGTIIYGDCGTTPNQKILAFDIEETLTKAKSVQKWPRDMRDWVFWHQNVCPKVLEWHEKGFKIVLFTNQHGISAGFTSQTRVQQKIELISQLIGAPMQALVASADDSNRKPSKGLWKYFIENLNGKIAVDLAESLYVGDAAGRDGKKFDVNDTDLKFALNIGIRFQTPEEFFLGEEQEIPEPIFDPRKLPRTGNLFVETPTNDSVKNPKGKKEVIVFVGGFSSGKSTFWKTHLSTYIRVSKDIMMTKPRMLTLTEKTMALGEKNLVIDHPNPTNKDRREYINACQKYGYDCRAFYFPVDKNLAFHLDNLKDVNHNRTHMSRKIGQANVANSLKATTEPKVEEGFSEVKTVNFIAGPFENKEDEEVFFSFARVKRV